MRHYKTLQDAALGITESFSGSEELVKLDLAYCGLTSKYLVKFGGCISIIQRVHELNLSGNAIMQEVCQNYLILYSSHLAHGRLVILY